MSRRRRVKGFVVEQDPFENPNAEPGNFEREARALFEKAENEPDHTRRNQILLQAWNLQRMQEFDDKYMAAAREFSRGK